MRVGGTRFDPWVALVTVLFGGVAIGSAYALRGVLVQAPSTAFPLLFTVTIGGVFVVVWLRKRRGPSGEEVEGGDGEDDA